MEPPLSSELSGRSAFIDDSLRDSLLGKIWITPSISSTTRCTVTWRICSTVRSWTSSCSINRTTYRSRPRLAERTQSSLASFHLNASTEDHQCCVHRSTLFSRRFDIECVSSLACPNIPDHHRQRQDLIAHVDSTCNVRTTLVDADGAFHFQIGIGSPPRARSSIFVRNASLVAPSCASKSARSFCSVCTDEARSLVTIRELS